MKKRGNKRKAERIIACLLVIALVSGTGLPGIALSDMLTGEAVAATPVQLEESDEQENTSVEENMSEGTEEIKEEEPDTAEEDTGKSVGEPIPFNAMEEPADLENLENIQAEETRLDQVEGGETEEPLAAVTDAGAGYIVTEDNGAAVGTYDTLAAAVSACPTGVACTITATQDDEISEMIEIPVGKEIILTSSSDGPWTITQKAMASLAVTTSKHFVVSGTLTLNRIVLAGTGDTDSATYNGGVYVNGITAKLQMENGAVIEKCSNNTGGGVTISASGVFAMTGGTIRGNKAGTGGGVYVLRGSFAMTDGEISGNEADFGGGVSVAANGIFEMTGGLVTGNTATDGGGIYTTNSSSANPASTSAYANITINGNAQVTGNTASAKYGLPVNHADFTNFPGELLNNNEINYKGPYLVQYDANNGTTDSQSQTVSPGTGNVSVTLLTESEVGFTAPGGKELTGWNTKADGTGDNYDPGATISIADSLTLYAVWEEPGIYIVTTEVDGTLIGTYLTLAAAVDACLTTEACVITATQDDEISECVSIPETKEIILTSASDGPWTITRTTTTISTTAYADRHFYVEGILTLANVVLSGTGNGGGGVQVVGSDAKLQIQDDAIIESCVNSTGGGVYVSGGVFVMTGGKISENKVEGTGSNNGNGGGVYMVGDGTFEMTGGEISANEAPRYGGGVCVSGGKVAITEGKISGNEAGNYGGGLYVTGNSGAMDGGEISANKAGSRGGGVYVGGTGSFNLTGGRIIENTADEGGAIYTADYNYDNPVNTSKYANITISSTARISGNTASAKYGLPVNYTEFNNFPGELLNNNEINYKGAYLVQYDANNGKLERQDQVAAPGTGSVSVTLLTENETGFTAPDGQELTEWNTKADGTGDRYDPGATITIDDSLTLYAVWGHQQKGYEITEKYYSMDGISIQADTTETVIHGEDYQKTAPVLTGYRYLGYQMDGGALHPDTTVTINAVDKAYTVTYVYEVYSEMISVSVPVKLLWAANESDAGAVISPDYYFYNHSSHDISVTLEKLTVSYDAGLALVANTVIGSGDAEVALQLEPLTDQGGWWLTNRVSLLAGTITDGLLGKIRAGDQGYFDLTGTYGGSFAGFNLTTGDYLQPEYKAVFCFELTH